MSSTYATSTSFATRATLFRSRRRRDPSLRYRRRRCLFKRLIVTATALFLLNGFSETGRAADDVVVVAFGDSLTAGYGLAPEDVFSVRLQQALRTRGIGAQVINAGLSGDTTAGGLARIEWSLGNKPDLVILQLGGNDALRGMEPAVTRANLDAILGKITARGIPVVLAGMYAPPNMGDAYAREFNAIYPDLAKAYKIPLYPFFLEGVAAKQDLNQNDGIHPNRRGVEVIVAHFAPLLAEILSAKK